MSNSKRSRKGNSKHSSQQDSPQKSDNSRSRKRKFNSSHNTPPSRCGVPVLSSSKLPKSVRDLIDTVFNGDNDLTKELIEEPAVRLLEEVTEEEALHAVQEFAERYKVAKHKILRSKAGYFRGVCQKYWKQNREHKKLELLRKAAINPSPNGKYTRQLSPLVSETIESLFTPASGLAVSIIDDSVQRRLTSLTDEQAIEALHEFCSAVMYRQDRIRNMNAYLMNIIKRRTTRAQHTQKGNSDTRSKPQTPSTPPNGNDSKKALVGRSPLGTPLNVTIPRKASRSPRSTPSSEQSYQDELVMKRIRSAGDARLLHGEPRMRRSDPRLLLQPKSNPIVSFEIPIRQESPGPIAPPEWNLTQSAPSARYVPTRRSSDPRMQRGLSDGIRFGKGIPRPRPGPRSIPSPLGNNTPSTDFMGYGSDDEEDSNMVLLDGYGDEEDDVASLSDHSFSDDGMNSKSIHVPQLGNGQRASNGPPLQSQTIPLMSRDSKPVPAMANRTREEEYKREIQKLKMENEELRDKVDQIQATLEQLQFRQNQQQFVNVGYESPQMNPAPYFAPPQMYGGYTPPTSVGSNASTSGHSQMYSDGGVFPPPNYVPNTQFAPPAMQPPPPFMGFMQPPGLPSNPNAPMFTNLSAPNMNAMPPAFLPHYPTFAMGPT